MPNGNYRVLYAISAVKIGNVPIHGVQSVSMTTNFSLEQVFEYGQLELYENVENVPDVEMTIERVLDGEQLMYVTATSGASASTLLSRTNEQCVIGLLIYPDTQDNADGTASSMVVCSGMFISSLSYNLPVQGTARENITFVGNDKIWAASSPYWGTTNTLSSIFGSDSPAHASGVTRRQHVRMGTGQSRWPLAIPGIGTSGYNIETSGVLGAHIQDVSISTNLGREDLFELGRRRPYYRYANFPVAVDTSINITVGGTEPGDGVNAIGDNTSNLIDETIYIKLLDGTVFDLGTKNKLQSVSYQGGDTGGGVASVTYNYQNFNILTITSP